MGPLGKLQLGCQVSLVSDLGVLPWQQVSQQQAAVRAAPQASVAAHGALWEAAAGLLGSTRIQGFEVSTVRVDLDVLRLLHKWSRAAQDRDAWGDKIQKLLGHTQHNAGNM